MEDENLASKEKDEMIEKVDVISKQKDAYDYWRIYDVCQVTSSYTCRPYFYTYSEFATGGYPARIIEVLNANIDRNYNGISKQFKGSLYYHLEASNKLYWDLNGDFYNNGSTTYSGGVSIKVGGSTTVNFSISGSSNYYAYCNKYDRVTF